MIEPLVQQLIALIPYSLQILGRQNVAHVLHAQISVLLVLVLGLVDFLIEHAVLLIVTQRLQVVEVFLTYLVRLGLDFGELAAQWIDQGFQSDLSYA